jgi:hypothetical protein
MADDDKRAAEMKAFQDSMKKAKKVPKKFHMNKVVSLAQNVQIKLGRKLRNPGGFTSWEARVTVKTLYRKRGGIAELSKDELNDMTLKFKRRQHKHIPEEGEETHFDDSLFHSPPPSPARALVTSKSAGGGAHAFGKSKLQMQQFGKTEQVHPPRDWDRWFLEHSHPVISYSESELPARGLVTAKNIHLFMRVKPHAPDLIRTILPLRAKAGKNELNRKSAEAGYSAAPTGTGVVVGFRIFRTVAKNVHVEKKHVVKGHERLAETTSTFIRGDAPELEMCAKVEWDEWGPANPRVQNCFVGKCNLFQLEKSLGSWNKGGRGNKLKSLKVLASKKGGSPFG